jgi:hypothetical protein
MKAQGPLTININLDWRVLLVVVLIASALIFGAAAFGSVADGPLTTNDRAFEPVAGQAGGTVITMPEPPAGMDDVVMTTNGEWVAQDSLGSEPAAAPEAPAAVAASGAGRHFYLTDVSYRTDQLLTACAAGYHMASLWEILDVSNLVYDYNHPAAHRKADSGYGPPSYWHGWVRTGWASSGSATTGEGNCSNWSSTSSTLHGVSVRLSRAWETAPGDISTWDANTFTCSIAGPVWCVKD